MRAFLASFGHRMHGFGGFAILLLALLAVALVVSMLIDDRRRGDGK